MRELKCSELVMIKILSDFSKGRTIISLRGADLGNFLGHEILVGNSVCKNFLKLNTALR